MPSVDGDELPVLLAPAWRETPAEAPICTDRAASAERSSEPIYEALCTSTYLKDDDNWVRLSHQQTPVS